MISEPTLDEEFFFSSAVVQDLNAFKLKADNIISRMTGDLPNVADKVYTRDIFGEN